MILAGDIGGTSTRLGFFEVENGRLNLVVEQTYPSREHRNLEQILRAFISTHKLTADCAAFGIAGPVRHGRVETPNLSWVVDAQSLERDLNLKPVGLINDLEANA